MTTLFETPIKLVEFRKREWAYEYRNGTIDICGIRYIGYSMTEAIRRYRKQFPLRQRASN